MNYILLTEKAKRRLLEYSSLNLNPDFWEKMENNVKHPSNEKLKLALKSLVEYRLVLETNELQYAFYTIFQTIFERGSYFIVNGEQAFLNAFEGVYQDYKKDILYNWKSK